MCDYNDRARLDFLHYSLGEPKYDVEECRYRGKTYASPLKVVLRLLVWDVDETTGARSMRDAKEQDVYFGDIPLMTESGTFLINGTERVIVSQMHRSPGVFFDHDKGKTHSSGRLLYSAQVIPYRGAWLEFDFDAKDILYVRVDRRRKLPVTTLLMALESERTEARRAKGEKIAQEDVEGMSKEEILSAFYGRLIYKRCGKGWSTAFSAERYKGTKLQHDLIDAQSGEVQVESGRRITAWTIKKLAQSGLKEIFVPDEQLLHSYVATGMASESNQTLCEAGDEITESLLARFADFDVDTVSVLLIDPSHGPHIRNTLVVDNCEKRRDALYDVYRVMRPGEPLTPEGAENLLRGLFFDEERYDLSAVGRFKMNARLGWEVGDVPRVLRKKDILQVLRILVEIRDGRGEVDDIDHLGNRRVRSVGELMENQFHTGLMRMERSIRERMSAVEVNSATPHDLISAKPVAASVRDFFGSSQLSQFMDQTNPLAEVTHKRRVSALGPGGLTRERAGFEVRDVHATHYGRICPIETPEGPNIGLINSLATYARVNRYGFLESPYRLVSEGRLTDEIVSLSADEEARYAIGQATLEIDEQERLVGEFVPCRKAGEYMRVRPRDVDLLDISPKQMVSVSAALIPFLENDDANRALMGSNMQRQAVPLLEPRAPLVGTGMEHAVARDSGAAICARRAGTVEQVDSIRIVIQAKEEELGEGEQAVDIYNLKKFHRSNQSTCINQRPLVRVGDVVVRNDIIADGTSTHQGELALGRDVLVAFMPWQGYNFEDSILISERLVREDVFTSIHIEEFEANARDMKLGHEEITRDIPNVSEDALRNLDETGIVCVGSEIRPGDILVGKVTPKGESPMTPEEKLLRSIFGEKAADVRDTSLRAPPGTRGTVVDVRVFSRRGVEKDERAVSIEREEADRLAKDRDDERKILHRGFLRRLQDLLCDQIATNTLGTCSAGAQITEQLLSSLPSHQWSRISVRDDSRQREIESHCAQYKDLVRLQEQSYASRLEKLQRGDDLAPGVMKTIKVFVAAKRKLQPGDKMSGRHGNKGVVSKIAAIEDMPHTEDGVPVDIVLNPLGVPSRMNVGQILETHLGWACHALGRRLNTLVEQHDRSVHLREEDAHRFLRTLYGEEAYQAHISTLKGAELRGFAQARKEGIAVTTPVFDGAQEADIARLLTQAGLDPSGQVRLIDGLTGEFFDRPVTVGCIYMLKLHHLVEDKIHSRSVGPYSLVTQQPLGGKSHFGGQRFGEMEVWALEAYGAAYALQEMLTVKSDDVSGRSKLYEAIVKNDTNFDTGIPESFNVLIKELWALGLDISLE